MAEKQIGNAGKAWSAGATWTIDNDGGLTSDVVHLLNSTGQILYEGDLVAIDVTGTLAVLGAGAGTPTERKLIGAVGGEIGGNISAVNAGGFVPQQLNPTRTDVATVTNTSATVTDASILASDQGRVILPSTAFPSGAIILFVTAATSFVASVAASANATSVTISDAQAAIGPGWPSTSQFAPGAEVPIVKSGWGKVNVAGAAVAAGDLLGLGNVALTGGSQNNTGGITVAAASGTVGTIIAVALEAQAARDLSITNAGIGGHEPIRAIIGRM